MGPNEVTKEYLGSGFQNSNNPFDTAMPGRALPMTWRSLGEWTSNDATCTSC